QHDQFICQAKTSRERVAAMESIRKTAPNAAFRVQGGVLRLDQRTVLALWAVGRNPNIRWSHDATRLADTLARNYVDAAKARERVAELQRPGAAEKALRAYELLGNLDEHQKIAVAAM